MARKSGQKPVGEVPKFGGASLADGAAYRHAAGIVQGRGAPAIAVVSAPAGVTDALLALAVRAAAGEKQGLEDGAEALRRRYRVEASPVQHSQIARRCLPELLTLSAIDFDWSKP